MNSQQPELPYISAKQAAAKWGVSLRRVSKLCQEGRIKGAFKLEKFWLIPRDAEKPADERCANKGGASFYCQNEPSEEP